MSGFFDEEEKSLVDRLDSSSVAFYDEVSKSSILELMKLLREVIAEQKVDPITGKKCIYLYIHSEGGDLYSGISAYDHIIELKKQCDIYTIMDGFTASAATLMFLAGTKRYAMRHAYMLIHQLRGCVSGKLADIKDDLDNSQHIHKTLERIYLEHSNETLNNKEIKRILKREICLSAKKCYGFGLIDGVVGVDDVGTLEDTSITNTMKIKREKSKVDFTDSEYDTDSDEEIVYKPPSPKTRHETKKQKRKLGLGPRVTLNQKIPTQIINPIN